MGKKRARMPDFDPEQLPPHLRQQLHQKTMAFLQDLFDGERVPIMLDPQTGEQVIDIRKVCEKLGLDFETELATMKQDPGLRQGLRKVDPRTCIPIIGPPSAEGDHGGQ
jgi:hypothetical protein